MHLIAESHRDGGRGHRATRVINGHRVTPPVTSARVGSEWLSILATAFLKHCGY
ncbi:hypothetical protein SRL2020226_47100 [Mycobacterium kiyosense]|nr:hypothetical protein SRL2020226_47100 [Mycobacterium kiyosense]